MTKKSNREIIRKENVAGGKGQLSFDYLLDADVLKDKCGMFACVTIEKGATLGYHEHHGEGEAYYILSGTGKYHDNDKVYPVKAGDVVYCADGSGHGLDNTSDEGLKFIALIIKA